MRATFASLVFGLLVAAANGQDLVRESIPPDQISINTPLNPQEPLVLEGQRQQSMPPAGPMTDSCGSYFGRGQSCPPLWTLDQGVRLLNRSRSRLVALTYDALIPDPGTSTLLHREMDSRSANFGIGGGYSITLGRYLGLDASNRDDYFEFTYWGLNHWDAGAQARLKDRVDFTVGGNTFQGGSLVSHYYSPTQPLTISPTQNFNFADVQSLQYGSEVHNFEWNLRVKPRGRPDRLVLHPDGRWERESRTGWECTYLLGIRYMSWDESFLYTSTGSILNGGTMVSSPTGSYRVFTNNDMAGIQFGGDIIYNTARWGYGFRTKICPATNFAQQSSYIKTTGGTTNPLAGSDMDIALRADKNPISLIGDLGFLATYRLRPNFTVSAAYDFVWITGVALAPEQMQFVLNPTPKVGTTGNVLLQGLSLQAEIDW